MKTNFSKSQKVTMGAVIAIGLFNPASVTILEQYFEVFYTGVFVVATAWTMGYLMVKVLTPQKINIPAKGAKTHKAGKLIVTQ